MRISPETGAADAMGELASDAAFEGYLEAAAAHDVERARENIIRLLFWNQHRSPEQVARLERALNL